MWTIWRRGGWGGRGGGGFPGWRRLWRRQDMSDVVSEQPAVRDYARLIRRMERVIAVSQTLAATLEQDRLLRLVVEAARDLVGSEAASILLLDPLSSELHFEASTSPEPAELAG